MTTMLVVKRKKGKKVEEVTTTPAKVKRPNTPRVVAQGDVVKGMTFGKLVEVIQKLGIRSNPALKRIWSTLRTKWQVINLTGFKVHPSRGGPFNEAFLKLPPAEQKKWSDGVIANPPPDQKEYTRNRYGGKVRDPVQVFWDLVTLDNMPEAVRKVPMTTAHFRQQGLAAVSLVLAGKAQEGAALLGSSQPTSPKERVNVGQAVGKKPHPKKAPRKAPAKSSAAPVRKPRAKPSATPAATPAAAPAPAAEPPAPSA